MHLFSVNAGFYPANLMDLREMLEFFGWILIVVWMLATGLVVFTRPCPSISNAAESQQIARQAQNQYAQI